MNTSKRIAHRTGDATISGLTQVQTIVVLLLVSAVVVTSASVAVLHSSESRPTDDVFINSQSLEFAIDTAQRS